MLGSNRLPLKALEELREGDRDLLHFLSELCDRIDQIEERVHAFVPEPNRRSRLLREGQDLLRRFPDPPNRPPLFGLPVGVKDIFHADGFPTMAGSKLPTKVLAGTEAPSVTALKKAGAK